MKKTLSRILLPFVTIWLVMLPARVYAYIQLIPGVQWAAAALGASDTMAFAIDASIALHAAVLGVAINTDSSTSTTNANTPLRVQINPNAPLAVPPGWTASASGIQPTPPASAGAPVTQTVYTYAGSNYATPSAVIPVIQPGFPGFTITTISYGGNPNMICVQSGVVNGTTYPNNYGNGCYTMVTVTATTATTCPAGYTVSGSICNLTTPAAVKKPSDGQCVFVRTGNAWAPDAQDPDCASVPATPPANLVKVGKSDVAYASNSITAYRPDGSSASVVINANGSTTVTETYPNSATNQSTVLTTSYAAPDATGAVYMNGSAVATNNGTGALSGATTGNAATQNVTFDKTGLATDATLQTIKANTDVTAATSGTGAGDFGVASEVAALSAAPGILTGNTYDSTKFKNDIKLPVYDAASCQPLTGKLHGVDLNINLCPAAASWHWVVDTFTAMAFGFMSFNEIFRRQEGV